MLKNLKTGDRFVDEIGRVFLVKKVIPDGYETEFIGLTDYEEGQKPYRLEAEEKKPETVRKKGGRKTNRQEEENQQTDDVRPEGEEDKDGENAETGSETPEDEKKSEEDK
jgi:hypothetical protein